MFEMFDWDKFRTERIAIELNNKSEVYAFLRMASNQGFKLNVEPYIYANVIIDGFKYFYYNHIFRSISVSNRDRFESVIKYNDLNTSFPSKESLMKFLNGGS